MSTDNNSKPPHPRGFGRQGWIDYEPEHKEPRQKPIYPTLEAAYEAHDNPEKRCNRPSGDDPSGHWWLIDREAERKASQESDPLFFEVIFCACRTCGAQIHLSAAAPEYPPV